MAFNRKEYQLVHRKLYYLKNKDKIKAASKLRYQNYKDQIKEYKQLPEVRLRRKLYNQTVRPHIRQYERVRYSSDLNYKLRKILGNTINQKLRQIGTKKSFSSLKLIGCTVAQLRAHIEKQFQPYMSWNNYGEWEVDHIKPCAKFNLVDIKEQQKCFHYTNLQPLWRGDNRAKNTRYETTICTRVI